MNNLAGNLGIDNKTTFHYVHILQQTGLAQMLYSGQRGTKLLRSPEKVFLANTTLLHALCDGLGQQVDTGGKKTIPLYLFGFLY